MSDQGNIFNPGGTPAPEAAAAAAPAPAPEPSFADKLSGITNETGEQKYRDVPTALDALAASQSYIPQLQAQMDAKDVELQELRLEVARSKGLEDAMNQFQPQVDPTNTPVASEVDPAKAREMLETIVAEQSQAAARQSNIAAVVDALGDKYGDKAEEMFYGKAKELGLGVEGMNRLAQESPKAVLQYFQASTDKDLASVEAKSSIYVDPTPKKEIRLERNQEKSILMGSTSKDVRAEFEYNKQLVAAVHAEGGSIEDLSDPKTYRKYFAKR